MGAICRAVDYLARNGLLNNYKHTGNALFLWKNYSSYTNSANFFKKQAIRDKNLITANGTASFEFTKLVLNAVNADNKVKLHSKEFLPSPIEC